MMTKLDSDVQTGMSTLYCRSMSKTLMAVTDNEYKTIGTNNRYKTMGPVTGHCKTMGPIMGHSKTMGPVMGHSKSGCPGGADNRRGP